MQKISLIAQSVLELSHREKVHDDNDSNDDDTHPGWIIVRDGMYSVADKNNNNNNNKNNNNDNDNDNDHDNDNDNNVGLGDQTLSWRHDFMPWKHVMFCNSEGFILSWSMIIVIGSGSPWPHPGKSLNTNTRRKAGKAGKRMQLK